MECQLREILAEVGECGIFDEGQTLSTPVMPGIDRFLHKPDLMGQADGSAVLQGRKDRRWSSDVYVRQTNIADIGR